MDNVNINIMNVNTKVISNVLAVGYKIPTGYTVIVVYCKPTNISVRIYAIRIRTTIVEINNVHT